LVSLNFIKDILPLREMAIYHATIYITSPPGIQRRYNYPPLHTSLHIRVLEKYSHQTENFEQQDFNTQCNFPFEDLNF